MIGENKDGGKSMTYKRKKPMYVSLECSVLMSHLSRMMSYEERGRWISEFAFHLVNGDGENEYARELLKDASERLDEAARKKAEYREKKKAEEEARKASKSAARKNKEVAEEPRQDVKAFGSANNVFLSNDEIDRLKEYEYSGVRIGRQDILDIIEEVSAWKAKGNNTKSDYATILSWFQRRVKEKRDKGTSQPKSFQQMRNEQILDDYKDILQLKGIM